MLEVIKNLQSDCFLQQSIHWLWFVGKTQEIGSQATGIMRENSLKCPLKLTTVMKIQARGSYDYRFNTNSDILTVKWLNNKCVIVRTNYHTVEPLGKAQPWKKNKEQNQCVLTTMYIASGVDQHDWLVSKCSTPIKVKDGISIFSLK